MNSEILAALKAAGATSDCLSTAWVQAVQAAGDPSGKMYSYLASQGFTGTPADKLFAYLGSKGYAGTLSDRLYAAALASDIFTSGMDWTQFFGVSDDGFVFDGTQSRFYTDSAMTTEASASGTDPVGAIEDVSGKGRHAKQASSPNKPIFYSSGGIKSAAIGEVSSAVRGLAFDSTLNTTAAVTIIGVWKWVTDGPNGTYVMSNYNGGWGTGYFAIRCGEGDNRFYASSAPGGPIASGVAAGNTYSAFAERTGTGTNQSALTLYTLAGAQIGTGTGTANTATTGPARIGIASLTGIGSVTFPMLMMITRALTVDERAAIKAYIESTFGAWTP